MGSASGLAAIVLSILALRASAECCTDGDQSEFCLVYNILSPLEQAEVQAYLGESCTGDVEEALKKMEKRNPDLRRLVRSDPERLSRSAAKPNFLRFGRAGDPNFLRFGKRGASGEPNFLRFGKSQSAFDRESRQPNFLRFGK